MIAHSIENGAKTSAQQREIIVVKFGSNCILTKDHDSTLIDRKGAEAAELMKTDQYHFVLVVSGAIALGKKVYGDNRKNEEIPNLDLQAYATNGQLKLMDMYRDAFGRVFAKGCNQMFIAKNMMTNNWLNKTQRLSTKGLKHYGRLINRNLDLGSLSLINYDDSSDTSQLRKDNDTLAADVLKACGAHTLVILGRNYDGFIGADGKVIGHISEVEKRHYDLCRGKSDNGTGGFKTKLDAARIVLKAGGTMIIGNIDFPLRDLLRGDVVRTEFSSIERDGSQLQRVS